MTIDWIDGKPITQGFGDALHTQPVCLITAQQATLRQDNIDCGHGTRVYVYDITYNITALAILDWGETQELKGFASLQAAKDTAQFILDMNARHQADNVRSAI